MSAAITDKITDTRNAARPNSARATGTRSAAGVSLACDNLAGWPTASKVHFVTYQVDSSSNPVAGTQLDCSGIVSGNSITSFTVIDGTDLGNSVGDYVEMLPTAAWGQDLSDVLASTHARSGGLKSGITIPSPTITTPTLTTPTSTNGTFTAPTIASPVFAGTASGALTAAVLSNPYKFSVYRNAATTSSSSGAVIPFDTKLYDTGTNIDVVTNKGRFTAPIAGFYCFSGSISIQAAASSGAFVSLYKNGTELYRSNSLYNASGSTQTIGPTLPATTVSLAANDYVELFCLTSTNTETINVGVSPIQTFFNGCFVSVT